MNKIHDREWLWACVHSRLNFTVGYGNMKIYDMRADGLIEPLGIGDRAVTLTYKLSCDRPGAKQVSRRVTVYKGDELVYDSGKEETRSMLIRCAAGLEPSTEYHWRVEVTDEMGKTAAAVSRFETGLMGTAEADGAEWIGSPFETENTDALTEYEIESEFEITYGDGIGICAAARDKDNYVMFYIDKKRHILRVTDHRDNAWTDGVPTVTELCAAYIPEGLLSERITAVLAVNGGSARLFLNGTEVLNETEVIPEDTWFAPRKRCMLNFGFMLRDTRAVFKRIEVRAPDGRVFQRDAFENNGGALSCLGEVTDEGLVIEDAFELADPSPAVNAAKRFAVGKSIAYARLYASAMGFYEVYINGKHVGEDLYAPGFTDYRKRMYYQTYDVTECVKQGENVISATVAKGYYSGYVGYSQQPMVYGRKNAFWGKLLICYKDGSSELVATDPTWLFSDKGPVKNADYLQGEEYDARLEPDMSEPDDPRWSSCGVVPWPRVVVPTNGELRGEKFVLEAQRGPSASVERVLEPVGMTEMPEGHFVFDMGQNMVGTVRVTFCGRSGTSVRLRYGEMCRGDGSLYTANLRSAANTDIYTMKGGEEIFVPSFTSHGFRYVEITGNGFTLTADEAKRLVVSVEGLVVTNTAETAGHFECSNKAVNRLQSCIEWGQRGNSLLVFTDCPQRNERMGWTGDAQVFAKTAAYNMYIKPFMDKWLTDLRDAQLMYNRGGAVPDTAPLGGDNRAHGGCAGWGDAAAIVPWEMYMAYGDISVLEDNYDMMRAWAEERSTNVNFGMRVVDGKEVPEQSDLASEPYIQKQPPRGDHLAFDETTPFILSATAYAARVAEIVSETARLLGKGDDAARYEALHKKIVRAFREAWVCDDGSIAYWGEMSKNGCDAKGNIINRTRYGEGCASGASQTAYALAIDFGLIPEEKLARAAECFKRAIDDRGGRLSVGFLGISHLLPALEKAGLTDTAFALLECDENPSWLYSVKNGATTIWERWDSYVAETDTFGDVSMNSFNHYAYGAVGEWMFGTILGINAAEPGYRRIVLRPVPGGTLTYAKGSYESAAGLICSEWKISGDRFIYRCEIPANAEAELYLPGRSEPVMLESGRHEYIVNLQN